MNAVQREPGREERRRLRLPARIRSSVSIMLVIAAIGAGIGIDRFVLEFAPVEAQSGSDLVELDEFTVLEETYNVIRDNYVVSDEISDEELIWGASRGMVDALGDTGHSTFLDPDETVAFEQSSRGELIGIGIQLDTSVSPPVVIMPIQDSPAAAAGIEAGDEILAVDGQDTTELDSPEDVGNLIRGEAGTDVTLELRHAGETAPYEVTITRARIKVDPVSWAMLPDNILWIRISEFSSGATEGVEAALQAGIDQGAEGVILDLRANPGGLVFEAIGVGSQFLPDESILYQEQDAEDNVTEIQTVGDNGLWQEGPLVVLINGDSASASEIVSSSIQANDRGVLIGETTFGTGTVLLPYELSDGSSVLIGIQLWLDADGEQIWKVGVDPNTEVLLGESQQVSLPYSFEENVLSPDQFANVGDDQLTAAYEEVSEEVAGQ